MNSGQYHQILSRLITLELISYRQVMDLMDLPSPVIYALENEVGYYFKVPPERVTGWETGGRVYIKPGNIYFKPFYELTFEVVHEGFKDSSAIETNQ